MLFDDNAVCQYMYTVLADGQSECKARPNGIYIILTPAHEFRLAVLCEKHIDKFHEVLDHCVDLTPEANNILYGKSKVKLRNVAEA
jgi:hypothetical protein